LYDEAITFTEVIKVGKKLKLHRWCFTTNDVIDFRMPEELRQFCLVDFMQEVRVATSHIQLSLAEKGQIEGNTIGTVLKLLYAFLWQEEVLVASDILLDPFINKVSPCMSPCSILPRRASTV